MAAYWYQPQYWSFRELFEIKKGTTGDRAAALQLNLRQVLVDGVFGDLTEERVKEWQSAHKLVVDGQPGQKTQASIVRARSSSGNEAYKIPSGLLMALAKHESGCALAAYSDHPSDWGYDLGCYQNSIGPAGELATQSVFEASYDAEIMARRVASNTRAKHDQLGSGAAMDTNNFYSGKVQPLDHYDKNIWSWQLAIYAWNWPFAAQNLSNYGHCYQDPKQDDAFQQWIFDASGGRLNTAREWTLAYIDSASKGIKWPS